MKKSDNTFYNYSLSEYIKPIALLDMKNTYAPINADNARLIYVAIPNGTKIPTIADKISSKTKAMMS